MNTPQNTTRARNTTAAGSPATDPAATALPFADLASPIVGFAHMQAVSTRMVLTQQQALLGFLNRRCEQDLRLLNDIAAAKEPQEMMTVLTDFYRDAVKVYSAEMGRSLESAPKAAAPAGEATVELARTFSEPKPIVAAA